MGALPRPDVPPGPHHDLVVALHELHHRAGWPSLRRLAADAGCSHTTVSHVFSSPRLPAWGTLELVVEALGGDVVELHRLWLAASNPTADDSRPHPVDIAGRATELATVRRHAVEGSGLLVVLGEAGVGKTRLVEVATRAAGAGVRVLVGACLPLSREVSLLPMVEVLRAAHDADGGAWLERALTRCPTFVPGSVARLLPEAAELATHPDPDDEWSRPRLYSAIAFLLSALARLEPTVVVLEDLHWADDATLDLVENLVARPPTLPAIGTWRCDDPDVPQQRQEWLDRVRRTSSVRVLELAPLDRAGTAEQLRLFCGPVPDQLVDRVFARSGGLPLFTEQLATEEDGELPQQLEDALARRLDRLGDASWRVARILGVGGRGLTADVVAAATGLSPDALTTALHDLRDRRLLRADNVSGTVELRHPLLAEAAVRMQLPGEVTEVHRRLALALAAGASPNAAEVAAHWQSAGSPEDELTWRIRAAREAGLRFVKEQEAEHWLRALELWPESLALVGDPPLTRVRATFNAMYALESSSQTRRAAALVETLMDDRTLGSLERAELCMLAADYSGVLVDPEQALELAEQGVALLEDGEHGEDLVKALRTRAWLFQDLGRWDAAKADVDRALAVNAEVGDRQQQRRLIAAQGWFDFVSGEPERGLARIAAAASMTEPPDPLGDAYVAMVHSDVLLELGAPAIDVAVATENALRVADELKIGSQLVATSRSNTAEAWLHAGEVDLAARAVGAAADGEFRHEYWALFLTRAEIDIVRGLLDEAAARVDVVAQHEMGAHAQLDYLAEVRTKLLLWRREPEHAWEYARVALRRWGETGEHTQAEQLVALGARAVADAPQPVRRALSEELHALVTALPAPTADRGDDLRGALAAVYAAELARAAGSATSAQWTVAAAGFDRVARPHPAAYCRWRAGQVALAEGRGSAAWRLLARAMRDARQHVPLTAAIRSTRPPHAQ